MADVQRGGHLSVTIGRALTLADIRVAQGRLRDAMQTYEQVLQLASEQGVAVVRGTADVYVGMSELQRERNDLEAPHTRYSGARSSPNSPGLRRTGIAGG